MINAVKIIQKYDKKDIVIPREFTEVNMEKTKEKIMKLKKLHMYKLNSVFVDIDNNKIITPKKSMDKEKASWLVELALDEVELVKVFVEMDDKLISSLWEEPYASQLKINELFNVRSDDGMDVLKHEIIRKIKRSNNFQLLQQIANLLGIQQEFRRLNNSIVDWIKKHLNI